MWVYLHTYYILSTRPFQLSTTKSEKLLGKESNSKYKPKKVWAKGQSTGVLPTRAHHSVARSSVKVQEEDEFPDIETMPERVDECTLCVCVCLSLILSTLIVSTNE